MELKDIIENTRTIYMTDSSLNILMDVERVVDNADMYAFDNWIKGELVQGPEVDKYWISCSFMYPYKMRPDPRAGIRLLDYGCKITYKIDYMTYPLKIESPDDFEPGTKKPKKKKFKVWIVTIRMPKELISDTRQGYLEIAGEQISMEDVDEAMDQDLDEEGAADGSMGDDISSMDAVGNEDEFDFGV